jgi:hypothetical protein
LKNAWFYKKLLKIDFFAEIDFWLHLTYFRENRWKGGNLAITPQSNKDFQNPANRSAQLFPSNLSFLVSFTASSQIPSPIPPGAARNHGPISHRAHCSHKPNLRHVCWCQTIENHPTRRHIRVDSHVHMDVLLVFRVPV